MGRCPVLEPSCLLASDYHRHLTIPWFCIYACISGVTTSPRSGGHCQQGVGGTENPGGVKEVLLNDTVCSNHYADEAAKGRELMLSESGLLAEVPGGSCKPGKLASCESLWG